MEIKCNLVLQWYSFVRDELKYLGLDVTNKTDQECAIVWISWKRRKIKSGVRTFNKSAGFQCPSSRQVGLSNLEKAFTDGVEVWPWQSTLIDRLPYEDGMFNDFGIMHFHLGVGPYTRNPNYIDRTNELLFAVVNSNAVYEIGIYLHNEWYELDVLNIINDNWPNLLDQVTINAVDIKSPISNRMEVKKLREEAKTNLIIKLNNGRIIAPPGGGIMTNGTSFRAVQSADLIIKTLRNKESIIPQNIRNEVQNGKMKNKNYDIFLRVTDDEIFGITDEGVKFPILEIN